MFSLMLGLILSAQPNTEVQDPPIRLVPGMGQPASGESSSAPGGASGGAAGGRGESVPGSPGMSKEARGLVPPTSGEGQVTGPATGGSGTKSGASDSQPLPTGSSAGGGGLGPVPQGGSGRLVPPGGFPGTGTGGSPPTFFSSPTPSSTSARGADTDNQAGSVPLGGGAHAGSGAGKAGAGSTPGPPRTVPGRVSPSALLAELLTLPNPSAVTGRPLTLLEALSTARDVGRQAEVVHAYWRAVEALGAYRAAADAAARLGLAVRPEDGPMLRAAQTAAQASVQVAAARALVAQHELGDAALLGLASGPPLPADSPHVGGYRTGFDEVYAMRGVAPRARMLHRMLPLRRQTIEARAAAVQAAEDALQAVAEAYAAGRVDLAAVRAAVDQWAGQRQAFMAAVCQYNHDIADYALAVTGPVVASQSLVSMLILPAARIGSGSPQPSSPGGPAHPVPGGASSEPNPSGVIPATALEPAGDLLPFQPDGSGFPPGAKQIPAWGIPVEKPKPAAQSPGVLPPSREEPTLAPPLGKRAHEGASLHAPGASSGPADGASSATPDVEPKAPRSSEAVFPPAPMERVVRRFAAEPVDPSTAMAMFAGLADASPAIRATQLSRALYTPVGEPGDEARRAELGELLRSYLAADRRGLICAYWVAACRAAQHQALVRQGELLDSLVPTAVERRRQPAGAREMLQVRAWQLQTQADQVEAKARLLQAEFELTERSGRPLESAWLVPATLPHAGPYQLQLDSQPGELVNTWRVRGLAAGVSAHYESVQRLATAVVTADLARAEATAAYLRGSGRVEAVLSAIDSYTRQTLAFLDAVAQYNQAIANYALAVVPPTIAGDQLLRTLVVVR